MEEAFVAVFGVLMSLVMGVFPFVIIGFVVWYAFNGRKRVAQKWAPFAQQTGLHLTAGSFFVHPTVTGIYARFHVDLRTVTRGSGKNSSTYTVMTINLPIQNGLIVSFYKEGLLSKLGKALGTQDVQVGDPAFDEAFMIKSNSPQHVSYLLTPEIRHHALSMRDAMNVSLRPGHVSWEQLGTITDTSRLGHVLNVLVLISRQVLAIEAPHLLEQGQQSGQGSAREPQQAVEGGPVGSGLRTHMLKMSKCPNCGGKFEWDPSKTTDVIQCSYCGVSTKIKLL